MTCGTYAGAQRHRTNGEDPCEPCRLARNAYATARRRALGAEPTPTDPIIASVPSEPGIGVYVMFDSADDVLYIGRTKNPKNRLRSHKSTKDWWPLVARVEWTPCDGIHEARAVEKSLIRTFHPASNTNDALALEGSKRQTMPDWAAANLISMHEAANASTARESIENQRLNGYILALRNRGWTLASISYALGMTREAVRLRQIAATAVYDAPGTPAPPSRPTKPKKVKPTIPLPAVRELLELQRVAKTVRGWTPAGSPERAASERYSELLADWHLQGVSIYRIAQQMGVTHLAIRARLARHGYMSEINGLDQAKYGTPFSRGAKSDECKAGHPLAGANLYLVGGDPKRRVCRECQKRRAREYQERRRKVGSTA